MTCTCPLQEDNVLHARGLAVHFGLSVIKLLRHCLMVLWAAGDDEAVLDYQTMGTDQGHVS